MSDDIVIGAGPERTQYNPGQTTGVGAGNVADRNGAPSDAAALERAAIERNEQIARDQAFVENQTSAVSQPLLNPTSAPGTLQSVGFAAEENDNAALIPAEEEARAAREQDLGAPAARAAEQRAITADARETSSDAAVVDAQAQREQALLNGPVSAENRLIAQEAGSQPVAGDGAVRVGDGAASPAEQLNGVATYREATATFDRGAGGLESLLNGTSQAAGTAASGATPQAANDSGVQVAANDQDPGQPGEPAYGNGFGPEQTPGANGVIQQGDDDATTTVTAQRNQFADANNDQRQSALNAYELQQQLRTQNQIGITV